MCLPTQWALRKSLSLPIYAEVPIGYWQIRTLSIKRGSFEDPISITLRVGDLLDGPEGNAMYPTYSIVCNEKRLDIGEQLFNALRRLRVHEFETNLWIDAICMNQFDDAEKNQQVPRMVRIYSKAERVIVWLGEGDGTICSLLHHMDREPDEATKAEFKTMSESCPKSKPELPTFPAQPFLDPRNIPALSSSSKVTAMEALLNLPWFERLWTKQEVWAAQVVSLLYQDVDCAWDNFTTDTFLRCLGSSATIDGASSAADRLSDTLRRHERGDLVKLAETQQCEMSNPYLSKDHKLDLVNVIRRCHGSKCTLQKDYVYGVMGMSTVKIYSYERDNGDQELLPVSYGQEDALTFEDFAMYLMGREDNLSFLFLQGAFDNRPSGEEFAKCPLQSWVPDWRCKYGDLEWLRSLVKVPLSSQLCHRVQKGGRIKYSDGTVTSPPLLMAGYAIGTFSDDDLSSCHAPKNAKFALKEQQTTARLAKCRLGILEFGAGNLRTRTSSLDKRLCYLQDGKPLVPALSQARMVWCAPWNAVHGDVAVAAHGAYAPVLLRPVENDCAGSRKYLYVGPIILPDEFEPLVATDNGSLNTFEKGVSGKSINEFLALLLGHLGHAPDEDFEIV